ETIVIGGLIQREQSDSVTKVPGLGDIPVLGALFRSRKFLNKETELVVFVTPFVTGEDMSKEEARRDQTDQRLERIFQSGNSPESHPH
ncbi:hypothetical protein RZS08_46295, partial [Arthrospira platensis SPKY1]|nr:hypothetical protein [Arthrospira platensis SPKY1]